MSSLKKYMKSMHPSHKNFFIVSLSDFLRLYIRENLCWKRICYNFIHAIIIITIIISCEPAMIVCIIYCQEYASTMEYCIEQSWYCNSVCMYGSSLLISWPDFSSFATATVCCAWLIYIFFEWCEIFFSGSTLYSVPVVNREVTLFYGFYD